MQMIRSGRKPIDIRLIDWKYLGMISANEKDEELVETLIEKALEGVSTKNIGLTTIDTPRRTREGKRLPKLHYAGGKYSIQFFGISQGSGSGMLAFETKNGATCAKSLKLLENIDGLVAEGFDPDDIYGRLASIAADSEAQENFWSSENIRQYLGQEKRAFDAANLEESPAPIDAEYEEKGLGLEGRPMSFSSDTEIYTAPIVLPETRESVNISREFIKTNKESVRQALARIFEEKKIVLVGERHFECASLIKSLIGSLPALRDKGLTHVALEIDSADQEAVDALHYGDTTEHVLKRLRDLGVGNPDVHELLIMAKRLGMDVTLLDDRDRAERGAETYADAQNRRDAHMSDVLASRLGGNSKALVLIGSEHVEHRDGRLVTRLGKRISTTLGKDAVSNIRYADSDRAIDNEFGPTPDQILEGGSFGKDPLILPDTGPLQGNVNTDYVVLVPRAS